MIDNNLYLAILNYKQNLSIEKKIIGKLDKQNLL